MWGNIAGVMGKALETAQKLQSELENQMDAAVGASAENKDSTVKVVSADSVEQAITPAASIERSDTPPVAVLAGGSGSVNLEDTPMSSPSKLSAKGDLTPNKTRKPNTKKKPKSVDTSDEIVGAVAEPGGSSLQVANLEHEIQKLKLEHTAHVADLTAQLESQHAAHVAKLSSQHKAALAADIAEVISEHKQSQAAWAARQLEMEQHIKLFNQDSLDASISSVQQECDDKISKLTSRFEKERGRFAEQQKAAEGLHGEKVDNLRDEYELKLSALQTQLSASEGKVASLQAQLSANADGGDQIEAVTAEYDKQIDALRTSLAQKDDQINSVDAELKSTLRKHDSELTELQSTLNSIYEELAICKANSERHDLEKKEHEAEKAQHEIARAELQAVIAQEESARAELEAAIAQLEADQIQAAAERNGAESAALEELRAQLVQSAESLRATEAVLVQTRAQLVQIEAEKAQSETGAESAAVGEFRKKLHEAAQVLEEREAQLAQMRTQAAQKETDIATLLNDLVKVKEALAERERALETATKSLSEQHKQNHDQAQKIADLQAEIVEKDARSRHAQSSSAEDEENRKLVSQYKEQLRELGEKLTAFEKEGQSLARKQSEMEKVVRKSKADLREKDAEIQKLKDSKEQLVKAIEQTQDVLKKHEMESTSASKNLSAMQAVSQASTDKLVRLESDLTAKTEELASQRRALEAAWAEATELKRTITELKADRDDLRKRIGEGTSKAMETESSRRDIEKREAVLRATNSQLQDSLQRQMAEASVREERLREEVNEMRKRWQEAIGNRESMASELGNVTAPLLRQISSLQESVRVKSEHWQNVESSLSERALRAENAAEIAEHKRSLMEEQLVELKHQHASNSSRLAECQAQLSAAESSIERLKKRETHWIEEKTELDSKFAMEVAQRQSLQSSLREIEIRHKVEIQELQDSAVLLRNQNELELSMCSKDMDLLRDELALAKANSGTYGALTASSPLNKNKHGGNSSSKLSLHSLGARVGRTGSQDRLHAENGNSTLASESSEAAQSYASGVDQLVTTSLPNGDVTFAAAEKLQQRSRQRDDDMHALALQIQRLEASRNALLEEVSYLSMRNSQLEEQCASVPKLQAENEAFTKRLELVLVLLGEKDEELEAMMSDMQEVKHMYRAHLEELIEGSVGGAPAGGAGGALAGSAAGSRGTGSGYSGESGEEELTSIDLSDGATVQ